MTRLEALEAVAEAARDVRRGFAYTEALYAALDRLDALPTEPQPQGETVTLAVWRNDRGGHALATPGSRDDTPSYAWTRLGTVTLPLDRERGE